MKSNKLVTVMVDGILRTVGEELSDGSIVVKTTMALDIKLLWGALKNNNDSAYVNLRKFCMNKYLRGVYTTEVIAITCLQRSGLKVYRCKFHLLGKEIDSKIGSVYLREKTDGVTIIDEKMFPHVNPRLTPVMAT